MNYRQDGSAHATVAVLCKKGTADIDAAVTDARDAALRLLAARAADATVCPSEVARALVASDGDGDWRRLMPTVHAAIDGLLRDGAIRLSWKGEPLATRAGPYRIGRP